MIVIHPMALVVGGVVLGAPIAIHLLTRPRPVRLPFSAMRFLDSALRQRRFFHRLRDVLILAMRTALIVAIAAAFARPLLTGAGASAAGPIRRRVVILDVSSSMNARRGGVRVMERARAQALRYVRTGPDLRVNVVLAGARPRAVFDRFSTNTPALEAEIHRAEARDEALDARAALARAGQLLTDPHQPDAGKGQVVIITDLQETNWRNVAHTGLPPEVDILVEYVGLGAAAGNLAVANVAPEGRPEAGRPLRLRVEIANFSASDQARTVELAANGRVYRQDVQCRAWQTASPQFDLPADLASQTGQAGWVAGTASLLEARDALPADDVRHFTVPPGHSATVVLVSNQAAHQVGTSCYYLWRLLGPEGGRGERVLPVRTADYAEGGPSPGASAADLLVLVAPGPLGRDALERMASDLVRGRPLLYVVSEPADARNLAGLAEACGEGLRLPVRFAALSASTPGAAAPETPAFTLTDVRRSAPPFREFGDALDQLTQGVTAREILKTTPDERGVPEDVLARWSDGPAAQRAGGPGRGPGSAALVRTRAGRGALAIWNADLARSTLPRSAFFVACLRELVLDLLTDALSREGALPVGTAQAIPLPSTIETTAGLALIGPDGGRIEGLDVQEDKGAITWRWPAVGPPGVYRVVRDRATLLAVATACPSTESDLRPIAPAVLEARLASPAGDAGRESAVAILGHPDRPSGSETTETWPWFLVAAVALILFELAVWKLFRI